MDLGKISKSLLLKQSSIWITYVFSLLADFARTDLQDLLRTNEWQFPNYNEDLVGAMAALYRLQDTYNISSVDMINNNMPGKQNKNKVAIKLELLCCPHFLNKLVRKTLATLTTSWSNCRGSSRYSRRTEYGPKGRFELWRHLLKKIDDFEYRPPISVDIVPCVASFLPDGEKWQPVREVAKAK